MTGQVPFSSRRRWSALDLGDERLVLGAPERFAEADPDLVEEGRREASTGRRVLVLGRSGAPLPQAEGDPPFPADVRALGLVVLAERLRQNAAETVAFFTEQDVQLKVLSGDAPPTVGAIARDAGVPGSAPALDGEALPSEPDELREAVLSAPAVGRISPDGKRAVVDALTAAGRYVAMIGDGVNDVPALKEARLAIAQGSGTQMARTVADLVLVRSDFGVVPGMVAEGRQILRNIQRVAQLFVTKSVFVAVLGLAVAIPTASFPLLPRQFTIASTVTIGIPAFVLALAPSSGPWRVDRFLRSVASFAIPSGVAIGIGITCRLPHRALRLRSRPEPVAHRRHRDRGRVRPRRRAAARGSGRRQAQPRGRRSVSRDGAPVRPGPGRPVPAGLLRAVEAHRGGRRCVAHRLRAGDRRDARRAAPAAHLNTRLGYCGVPLPDG